LENGSDSARQWRVAIAAARRIAERALGDERG